MTGIIRETLNSQINDGFFDIKFESTGVYLTVYPPAVKGKKVEARDVIEKLNKKQVRGFSKEIIEFTVLKADRVPVQIASVQEEAKLDAAAAINVTPDKMKAFIILTPPDGGKTFTADQMLEILDKNLVINGINNAAIENLEKFPVYNEMVCVAEGTAPTNGYNGKVEFHFNISKDRKPTVLDDGRVDYRELNLIENVQKGQVLCTLTPPLPGIPGKTVVGSVIPALNGKPAVLPRGRNVEVLEDGGTLVAAIDGQVSYIDGKVNVFSNYEVPADVDNATGNIYFIGNVSIKGNVLSGFTVEAGGNVEVWGVVEGAVIKAGGDIILRRGMQGIGKGALISGGDIIARYIEYSNIEAKNDIKAEAIMHSNVKCGNRLELSGRKGLLVGGSCKVAKEISANVIGSHMSTVTDIEVGVDPTVRERYKLLKDEVINIENDLKKADQAITILKKLEASGMLTPEKQDMLAKSLRTKVFYTSKINELREEMQNLEEKLQQEANGKIRVQGCMYPGTRISIGSSLMYVRENLHYCTLYKDGADIRIGPIDK